MADEVDILGEEILRICHDTAPDEIYDYDETTGSPRNITGFSYTLTVNKTRNPPNTTDQLVSIAGVILNAAGGHVQFPWTGGNADQVPGDYWYDIQRTDSAGKLKTLAKNRYRFRQDITK